MPFLQVPRKLVLVLGLLDSWRTVVVMQRTSTCACLEANVRAESSRGGMLSFSVNELRERKTAELGIQVYLLLLFVIERMARILVLAVKTD